MLARPRRVAAAAEGSGSTPAARGGVVRSSPTTRGLRLQCASSSSSPLPSIRDFIASEAPIRGRDGTWREQLAPGAELADAPLVQLHGQDQLLVPGQRRLMYVSDGTVDAIVAAEGAVALAVVEVPPGRAAAAGGDAPAPPAPPNLVAPNRGSWAVAGRVCGVQRLPGGSQQALVRVLITDRIAVQALSRPSPDVMLSRSTVLRDRWCFFVRRAALDAHLGSTSTPAAAPPAAAAAAAGRDVLTAVEQVQDAATEVLSLLRQLAGSARAAVDAAESGAGTPGSLGHELAKHEAADELDELLAWCGVEDGTADSAGALLPADAQLLERAWRLSFAPFAAAGLAAALGGAGGGEGAAAQEALEITDLGLRLEAAVDVAADARRQLAARLGLEGLDSSSSV